MNFTGKPSHACRFFQKLQHELLDIVLVRSNAKGKLRRYCKDRSGGTAVPDVPKMMSAHCFVLALEALKWPSEKHQSSAASERAQTKVSIHFSED